MVANGTDDKSSLYLDITRFSAPLLTVMPQRQNISEGGGG